MRKGDDLNSLNSLRWKKEENNGQSILWSNESEIANVKIIAKKINSSEWKMWPEINGKKDEKIGITVPDKRCVKSMITSMKKIIDGHLAEASKSGKTIEEVIKNTKLF